MSIVRVREVHFGRSHNAFSSGKRDFTRHFQVETDNPRTSQLAVRLAAGIPRLFDFYNTGVEADTWCFVESIKVEQEPNNLLTWYVTVNYSSVSIDPQRTRPLNQTAGSPGQGQPSQTPEYQPDQFAWTSETYKHYVTKDINGDPVENSAGDPFTPPLGIDNYRQILTVTRWQLTFNAPAYWAYKGTVNEFVWNGFPPGTVLLSDLNARTQFKDNTRYWSLDFIFKIDLANPWRPLEVLDRGFNKKNPVAGQPPIPIKSLSTARNITVPANLNAAGEQLLPGQPKHYIPFILYYEVDFDPLNITIPMT